MGAVARHLGVRRQTIADWRDSPEGQRLLDAAQGPQAELAGLGTPHCASSARPHRWRRSGLWTGWRPPAPFEATTAAEAILSRVGVPRTPRSRRRWSPAWTCPPFRRRDRHPRSPPRQGPRMTLAAALPSTADLDREMVRRRGLREFVRRAWPQVEPARLVWGWHLDAVCEHLEAVVRDEITALVVNIPPGCSSPLTVSTLFPAWAWIDRPDWRWIAASYAGDVAYRDARRHRELVASDWWRERWPGVGIPSGLRRRPRWGSSTPAGQPVHHHHQGQRHRAARRRHIIDDPHDPHGVASSAELEATLAWWRETMPTRFRDPQHPRRILVMQRLTTRPHRRDGREGRRCCACPCGTSGPTCGGTATRAPRRAAPGARRIHPGPSGAWRRAWARARQRRSSSNAPRRQGAIFKGEWLTGGGRSFRPAAPSRSLSTQPSRARPTPTRGHPVLVHRGRRALPRRSALRADDLHGHARSHRDHALPLAPGAPRARRGQGQQPRHPRRAARQGDRPPGCDPEGGKIARASASSKYLCRGQVVLPHETDARYPRPAPRRALGDGVRARAPDLSRGRPRRPVDATTQYLITARDSAARLKPQCRPSLETKP